jgi:hypothetical protein
MISWRSFTTSKVLPTFVGEIIATFSNSASNVRQDLVSERFSSSTFETPAKTRVEHFNFFVGAADISQTEVIQNSTFYKRTGLFGESFPPIVHTAPLATIRQESTKTESYELFYRTTKTISAYDDGNSEPLLGYIWTTTITGTGTDAKTTFDQVETKTTETVVDFKTREGKRTVITTTGSPFEVITYTAIDGDIEVVAHTIWEATNAVSFDSPQAEIPVTQLAFAPTRFTLLFSETYTKMLPVRDDSESTKGVTTVQTISENHKTTTRGFSNESYKGWYLSNETRTCENRTGFTVYTEFDDEGNAVEYTQYDGVNRFIPESYKINGGFTLESQTVVNSTQETFETYSGGNSETFQSSNNRTTGIRLNDEIAQRIKTFYVPNTVSEQTSTFSVSGDFLTVSSQDWPGLANRNIFPWTTIGDGARRYFYLPNNQTTIFSTTSQLVTFGHTYQITVGPIIDKGFTFFPNLGGKIKKVGQFFQKNITPQIKNNTATAIAFQHGPFEDHGLASPQLTFSTQNNHATVGAFMSDNAQNNWENNTFGFDFERGFISQGVVGAVPLYPTFSGIIRRDAEGWELCDSSEYTTVVGSRIGQNFTTTIEWQTLEGTSTKKSTSSGSFTIQSTTVATVRAQEITPTIAGGFATPNASRTVILSPGVVLTTTYDASGSGTGSTLLSTGTTFSSTATGPQPITISSFIPRVQGYGVYTQLLLDNGMP